MRDILRLLKKRKERTKWEAEGTCNVRGSLVAEEVPVASGWRSQLGQAQPTNQVSPMAPYLPRFLSCLG